MKIRPLPDIDLARIAPLQKDQQRSHLEQIKHGRPPLSYGPLRTCFHDILNVQPELFGPVSASKWAWIKAALERKCASDQECQANICVAHSMYEFATKSDVRSRAHEFFPLAMGAGQRVVYWLSIILNIDGRALVPFVDPRGSRKLTHEARRFVFSIMHERIRASDPDFEAVGLAIFQFDAVTEGRRDLRIHTDDGIKLYSFHEIEAMVEVTYELWREICGEREIESRRKSAGARGPLV